MSKDLVCPICLHSYSLDELSRHHLVPDCKGGKEKKTVCLTCHKQIHATFKEKELAEKYNTIESILSAGCMSKYVEWIRKHKPNGRVKIKMAKRRK